MNATDRLLVLLDRRVVHPGVLSIATRMAPQWQSMHEERRGRLVSQLDTLASSLSKKGDWVSMRQTAPAPPSLAEAIRTRHSSAPSGTAPVQSATTRVVPEPPSLMDAIRKFRRRGK